MITPLFTSEEIAILSTEIDNQLRELKSSPISFYKDINKESSPLPPKQRQNIEQTTGEDVNVFWQKFKRASYNDLCKEGGLLYQQWKTYGDLSNEKALKTFGKVLFLMGITGTTLQTLVVAVTVIVLHLGIKAICEDSVHG